MERQLNKVKRWIDRCLYACSSSSWENAVADMECAKAELESAREELWAIVEGKREELKRKRTFRSVQVLVASFLFVMVAAIPLSMPDPVERIKESLAWEDEIFLLELVTPDEREILSSLRSSLSSGNLASLVENNKKEKSEISDIASLSPVPARRKKEKALASRVDKVPLDQVIELIEIGQRALKKDDSFVVITD